MAKATVLERILGSVGIPLKRKDTWSVVKVEKMLKDAGITNYEFLFQSKVVKLDSQNDLIRILMKAMPSEISKDSSLTITEIDGSSRLKIGNWVFEARD